MPILTSPVRQQLPTAAGFCLLAGCVLALWAPSARPVTLFIAVGIAVAVACLGERVLAGCWLLGAMLAGGAAWQVERASWPVAQAGERALALVEVASLPDRRAAGVEFDAEATLFAPRDRARPIRLRVRWQDGQAAAVRAGERWQLLLRLDPPRVASNPGGFERARALFRNRIEALASVVPSPLNMRRAAAPAGLLRLRASIARRIAAAVEDPEAAALLAALAVGATGEMTREQWRVFSATGTTHLVAISGLHVTLFALLAAAGARRLWSIGALRLPLDREPFALAAGLAAACAYALLAGFSVPTQRTLLMLAAWWGARCCGREQGGLEILSLALIGVLLLDPLAPLEAGFWLSFGAVALLIAGDACAPLEPAARARASAPARWLKQARSALLTQWRITFALAPATLLLFGSLPLAGLLANLFAIPLFSFLLVPLVLGSLALLPVSPALAAAGWRLAAQAWLASWPAFTACAELPLAGGLVLPPTWWYAAAVLALPLLLLPAGSALRATGLLVLLPLWWRGGALDAARGEFNATVLRAGDGLALVVETAAHVLVYDTGEAYRSAGDGATQLVLPFLRTLPHERVDLLVVSRANGYRVAGAGALLAQADVAAVRSGGLWRGAPAQVRGCGVAQRWTWDGVGFETFAAAPGTGDAPPPSCVLRIASGGHALLVPGGVDRTESARLAASGHRLQAEVAIAPRTGSASAIVPAFVERIGASRVIVSSREFSERRRGELERAWRLDPDAIFATAIVGALRIEARAGGPLAVRRLDAEAGSAAWRRP
jgi:competence protein ComEC